MASNRRCTVATTAALSAATAVDWATESRAPANVSSTDSAGISVRAGTPRHLVVLIVHLSGVLCEHASARGSISGGPIDRRSRTAAMSRLPALLLHGVGGSRRRPAAGDRPRAAPVAVARQLPVIIR